MKFNGLALLILLPVIAPLLWSVLRQSIADWANYIDGIRLNRRLRKLHPSDPNVPQIVAHLATLERTVP